MRCVHYHSANKRVLSNCLKLFAVNNGTRSSSLRQFQAAGPATEIARRPYMWRDCVEARAVDDDWQKTDDAVRQHLR